MNNNNCTLSSGINNGFLCQILPKIDNTESFKSFYRRVQLARLDPDNQLTIDFKTVKKVFDFKTVKFGRVTTHFKDYDGYTTTRISGSDTCTIDKQDFIDTKIEDYNYFCDLFKYYLKCDFNIDIKNVVAIRNQKEKYKSIYGTYPE